MEAAAFVMAGTAAERDVKVFEMPLSPGNIVYQPTRSMQDSALLFNLVEAYVIIPGFTDCVNRQAWHERGAK